MSNPEELKHLILDVVDVRCIKCGKIWKSSLSTEEFTCMNCGEELDPKKHLVVKGPEEIN